MVRRLEPGSEAYVLVAARWMTVTAGYETMAALVTA
jgi:hypothetical protein